MYDKLVEILTYIISRLTKSCSVTIQVNCIFDSAIYQFYMHSFAVRVKGGISLRNGMWHGLRKDIIMRNLIYGKWRKEIN